jgi:hypothetical protein
VGLTLAKFSKVICPRREYWVVAGFPQGMATVSVVYLHSSVWYAGEKEDDRQEEREAFHGWVFVV